MTWNAALETGGVLVSDKVKLEFDVRHPQRLRTVTPHGAAEKSAGPCPPFPASMSRCLPTRSPRLRPRPARRPDLPPAPGRRRRAVFEVMAAQELEDLGVVSIEEADIAADLGPALLRRGIEHRQGSLDGDRLVAYAELMGGSRADDGRAPGVPRPRCRHGPRRLAAAARPRPGIERDPPAHAGGVTRRPAARDASASGRVVGGLGAVPARGRGDPDPPPTARAPAARGDPGRPPGLLDALRGHLLEWADRDRQPYDDFLASVVGRPGFEPWHLRVVTDPAASWSAPSTS